MQKLRDSERMLWMVRDSPNISRIVIELRDVNYMFDFIFSSEDLLAGQLGGGQEKINIKIVLAIGHVTDSAQNGFKSKIGYVVPVHLCELSKHIRKSVNVSAEKKLCIVYRFFNQT